MVFEGGTLALGLITGNTGGNNGRSGEGRIQCMGVGKLNRKCLLDIQPEMSRKQEELLRKVRARKTYWTIIDL